MTPNASTAPRFSIASSRDPDGRTVIAVDLSNAPGRCALVYVEDFCRLISEHGASAWFINRRTTRKPSVLLKSRSDGRQHLVARLVARDPEGHLVETRDSDFTNLRRGNISTRVGGRGGQRRLAGKASAESTGGDLGSSLPGTVAKLKPAQRVPEA